MAKTTLAHVTRTLVLLRQLIPCLFVTLLDLNQRPLQLRRQGIFDLVLAHLNFPVCVFPQRSDFISHILDSLEVLGGQNLGLVAPLAALGAVFRLLKGFLKLLALLFCTFVVVLQGLVHCGLGQVLIHLLQLIL